MPKLKAWFDIQPVCRPYAKNARFMELAEDWYYWIHFQDKDPFRVWIAKRYYYNGASIPWAARPIMGSPYDMVYWAGACGHDHGYLTHIFARDIMDEILAQLVTQSNRELKAGLGAFRIHLIWSAVRIGGALAYRNSDDDKRDLAEYRTMLAGRPDGDKFQV